MGFSSAAIRPRSSSSLRAAGNRCRRGLRTFLGEQRPVVAERSEVKELEAEADRRECSPGHTQLIADVKDTVLDVPLAELIRQDYVVSGQLANSPQILVYWFTVKWRNWCREIRSKLNR